MTNEPEFIRDLIDANQKDKAFKKLLDLYQERLYWHIRKIVVTHENADDVLQNTFLRVYKGLPNFKQNSSLHTWMYRIAYNESIRYLEQNKNNQQESLDDDNKTYLNNLVHGSTVVVFSNEGAKRQQHSSFDVGRSMFDVHLFSIPLIL